MFMPILQGIISRASGAGAPFMSFETVTGTLLDENNSVTLTFSEVDDATMCVPFLNCYTSNESGTYMYENKLAHAVNVWDDSGTVKVTITRDEQNTNIPDMYMSVTLVQFDSDRFNVYKYSYTNESSPSLGYVDKTITSVTTARSFCIVTSSSDNGDLYSTSSGMSMGGYLSGSTTLRLYKRYHSGSTMPLIYAYVVESTENDFIVSHTPFTMPAADSSIDVTVPSMDTEKSLVLVNGVMGSVGSGSYPNNFRGVYMCHYPRWFDSTTVRIDCYWGSKRHTSYGCVQVITFNAGVKIQRGTIGWGAVDLTKVVTIDTVDPDKTFVIDYYATALGNSNQNDTALGAPGIPKSMVRLEMTSATSFTARRGEYGTETDQYTAWQVIEITGEAALPTFDEMVADLSPDLFYDFQDASFSSGLEDQSGNDYDLSIPATYQGAVSIDPIRDSVTQAARITAHNSGNSYKGTLYEGTAHGTDMQSLFVGADDWCMQLAFRASNDLAVGEMALAGMTDGDTDDDRRPMAFKRWIDEYIQGQVLWASGGATGTTSPKPMNDGEAHIITMWNDKNGTGDFRFYLDGVRLYSTGTNTSNVGAWGDIRINVQGHSSYTTQDWETDHYSAWGEGSTLPTELEILKMHEKYRLESYVDVAVEDNFTDTDSTLLSAHTSDSGHDWTYFNGVTPDIQSNAVNCKGTCNFLLEPTIADAIVEVDLIQGGNQQATGFYWRSTSAFTNNFALWPDDSQLRFIHSTGSINLTESNNNSTMSTVVGFKGQEHRIWVNDVHKFTHTDANWTTQRYHGHRFYGGVNVLGVDNLKIHRCIVNPTQIDDCILWLDASDRGTTTNQWDDKSGKDYHFTSSVAGEFPTFSGGVATFDGIADHLDGPDISGEFADDVADVFILQKRYADNADAGFNTGWHYFGNSGSIFHFTYSSSVYDGMFCGMRHTIGDPDEDVSNYHVYNIISDDTDYQFNQDGVEQYASAASIFSAPTAPIFGKSNSSYFFQGDVKAIVIFSRKLTTVERAQMELYLANL